MTERASGFVARLRVAMDHLIDKARNQGKKGQRYSLDMTGPQQDAIASQSAIRSLADEALDEHRRGETRPLDELLG
jgi:hypothetical protein